MSVDVKLQNILLPMDADANLLEYSELMVKGKDGNPFCYNPEKKCHILKKYTCADMMTYYNSIQVSRWKKYTGIDNIRLNLTFKGKLSFEVYEINGISDNVCYRLILNKVFVSRSKTEAVIEIPATSENIAGFKITALDDSEIYGGFYSSYVQEEKISDVNLALVTTTFKKQEYIKHNISQLKKYVLCDESELKNHISVHIIDNERALKPENHDSENLKVYPNKNVGGSGGFARGMIEAVHSKIKPTNIILMDDDVMIIPESIFRTYYLLRLLKPEYRKCFISGAMFDYDHRELQYEDVGYVHKADSSYGPVKEQMDMRCLRNIVKNDDYDYDNITDAYAGWWYCCIPTECIEKNGLPLPVFVRGDDVEFSLRNSPGFITLDGICIWHVGFAGKFNPAMELYQVHRNSLIIQAVSGVCGDVDFLPRIKKMFWQEITRFAYNNAELLLDAVEDFLKGPKYLENLDGEKSMQEHSSKNEKLVPLSEIPYFMNKRDSVEKYEGLDSLFEKLIYAVTLNGHFLPDFMLRNYPSFISNGWLFDMGRNFRRKKLIAVNGKNEGVLRVIDRKRCFALIDRYLNLMKKYKAVHKKLEKAYRNHFKKMTSEKFWKQYLGI